MKVFSNPMDCHREASDPKASCFSAARIMILTCPRAQVIEDIAPSNSCKFQHGINDVRRRGDVGGQPVGMTQSLILLCVLGTDLSILLDQTYQADRKEQ